MTVYPEELLDEETRALRDEVRAFVKSVPRDRSWTWERERVRYPKDYFERRATGVSWALRFPEAYGGRNLPWTSEMVALEEVGVLGTSLACLYSLVSIVGEALVFFGTEDQKLRYLAPMLKGELTPAEALTEPRGGSDFFGATTPAVRDERRLCPQRTEAFQVGSVGRFFWCTPYADGGDPRDSITASW